MGKQVSIIIPVYNVREYLSDCLDSVAKQDYDNLQIILVDDGSTDGSGKMCDKFAAEHKNVEVIHQENQGLSGARNGGTKVATGDYIAYIDSDDWVSGDYISHQVLLAERYDADIVAVRQQPVWEGIDIEPANYSSETVICYNCEDALEVMLYGYSLQTSACKLFKRDVILKHPFPVGELYEDAAIMFNVVHDAERIVISDLPLYYYRRRTGSIIHERFDRRHMVILEHSKQLYEFIQREHPRLTQAAGYRCAYSATEIAPKIAAIGDLAMFRTAQDLLDKHYNDLMHNKKAKLKFKIRGFAIRRGVVMTRLESKAEEIYKRLKGKKLYGGR